MSPLFKKKLRALLNLYDIFQICGNDLPEANKFAITIVPSILHQSRAHRKPGE